MTKERYVHEVDDGVYLKQGFTFTRNISEAKIYNTRAAIKQTNVWYGLGGRIYPVQVSVAISGIETDLGNSKTWTDEKSRTSFIKNRTK